MLEAGSTSEMLLTSAILHDTTTQKTAVSKECLFEHFKILISILNTNIDHSFCQTLI